MELCKSLEKNCDYNSNPMATLKDSSEYSDAESVVSYGDACTSYSDIAASLAEDIVLSALYVHEVDRVSSSEDGEATWQETHGYNSDTAAVLKDCKTSEYKDARESVNYGDACTSYSDIAAMLAEEIVLSALYVHEVDRVSSSEDGEATWRHKTHNGANNTEDRFILVES